MRITSSITADRDFLDIALELLIQAKGKKTALLNSLDMDGSPTEESGRGPVGAYHIIVVEADGSARRRVKWGAMDGKDSRSERHCVVHSRWIYPLSSHFYIYVSPLAGFFGTATRTTPECFLSLSTTGLS
jgi:hypothetical protein